VEYESDHAPFDGELQSRYPSKHADKETGYSAHLRSDQHIFPEFDCGRCASIQQHARRLAVVKCSNLAVDVVDFQKSKNEISKRDEPEGQRGIDAAGQALRHS